MSNRIAFVADVHLANHKKFGGSLVSGINRRCRYVLDSLETALRAACQRDDCKSFNVLGDLLDSARPTPQELYAIQRILGSDDRRYVNVLRGNHEMVSTENSDHALAPLCRHAGIIDAPCSVPDNSVMFIPFEPGDAREWLPQRLIELSTAGRLPMPRVLATHVGIIDKDTPPWLRDAKDAVPLELLYQLCERHGFWAVFAGNWHQHKHWQRPDTYIGAHIVQVGALVPTGFDNPGFKGYGSLVFYEHASNTVTVEEIYGPRFLKLREDQLDVLVQAPKREKDSLPTSRIRLYVKAVVAPERVAWATDFLRGLQASDALCGAFPTVEDFEVVTDDVEARAEARTAATVARSAETTEQALAEFIEHMPVAEGVERRDVLARCKEFLR